MNIGFIGCGRMASKFVITLKQIDNLVLYGAYSHNFEHANKFKEDNGFKKAYQTLDEMLNDSNIDFVYISTPHIDHFQSMVKCIEYKKPVLCEKPFTLNAKEALIIKDLAAKNDVLVAEAMWPRYQPSKTIINEIIASKLIGEISMITANLSYSITNKKRIMDINLAGGALLDVGIYGLNFLLMHHNKKIVNLTSTVTFTNTGVDKNEAISVSYDDNSVASIVSSIDCIGDKNGVFYGTNGYMVVININNPEALYVYDLNRKLIKHIEFKKITGYEYEVIEFMDCVKNNLKSCPSMTLDDSIKIISFADKLRKSWDFKYPNE